MSFEDDSPISPTKLRTLSAVKKRMDRATELAIVMHDRTTFEALCDLHDLLEGAKKGLTLCRECDILVSGEHKHDSSSVQEVSDGASSE